MMWGAQGMGMSKALQETGILRAACAWAEERCVSWQADCRGTPKSPGEMQSMESPCTAARKERGKKTTCGRGWA